jgi:UDP-N-acetylmuramate dehydrogenase
MNSTIEKKLVKFCETLNQNGHDVLCARIIKGELMSKHTTMRVGGPADAYVEPASLMEITALYRAAKKSGLPFFILGNGSNLIVSDEGMDGIVISLGEAVSKMWFEEDPEDPSFQYAHSFSGALLSRVAMSCAKRGLSGLEFAAGIPGSIGGAVFMNAGAYGSQMSDVVYRSVFLTADGDLCTLTGEEHQYGYRKSYFTLHEGIVLSVVLRLPLGDPKTIMDRIIELNTKRSASQPLSMPSAGSIFKRPEGHYAGALIEETGLKGCMIGGAGVSEKHAGFIVNHGTATAQNVFDLVKKVQYEVKKRTGVELEPEIQFVGRGF